ncbi:MAG: T9SS type A sorting domain-containing protein [Bacteroidetes bacterium]|nr:T9SS type A sorting domain-containing protein [Bacteroidota bacterium]
MRNIVAILSIFLFTISAEAQLQFPNSTKLFLQTTENHLYYETEVLFHTGKYKITDYRFQKLSDSVDKNWTLYACINGDCKDRLTDSGSFKSDFGLNDTTGFIRVHVFTNDSIGSAKYSYRIINKLDAKDFADMEVKVTNKTSSGIEESDAISFNIYPNPAVGFISFQGNHVNKIQRIILRNTAGQIILSAGGLVSNQLNISNLPNGIYVVEITTTHSTLLKKIIKL